MYPDQLCSGFNEQGCYFFSVPVERGQLYIDDVQLSVVIHDGRRAWVWETGFYAGEVTAELTDPYGKTIALYRLGVVPQLGKLEQASFEHMVDDILKFDARLLMGTEFAQSAVGVEGDVSNLHLQYARLRRHSMQMLMAMHGVARNPVSVRRNERSLQTLNRVKRLDRISLLKAARNPAALCVIARNTCEEGAGNPIMFDVSTTFSNLDNPANQTLCLMLKGVIRRTGQVIDALIERAGQKDLTGARSALIPRLNRRIGFLQNLHNDLRRILRREPFASLKVAKVSAAGLNVISAHPDYARAYRFGWYILRAGIHSELTEERLWMSPTWEVYERWCYLKVVEGMRQRYSFLNEKFTTPTSSIDCIRFTGNAPDVELNIWLQARCPALDQPSNQGFSSISKLRVPDIAITLDAHGKKRFLILDAKYRTSRDGVLDAMQSAHIYRDSLRWFGHRPDCALLLVPQKGGVVALESKEYQSTHGVGVLGLNVTEGIDEVCHVIAEFLSIEWE
jgi:hypothetical protein